MRETAHVALLIVFMLVITAHVATGADPEATEKDEAADAVVPADPTFGGPPRERLTDLLFSDDIDRIDFQASTYAEGMGMVSTAVDRILEMGSETLGNEDLAADRGREVILALNDSKAKGLYATFQKDKQTLVINDRADANTLGKVVGTSITIIHDHYGAAEVSYKLKAANLFRRVRVDTDDTVSLVAKYLESVEFVAELPPNERAKYLN
jgi:hypothetical protein